MNIFQLPEERNITEEQAKRLGDTLYEWRTKWDLSKSDITGNSTETYRRVENGEQKAAQQLKARTIQSWCANGYRHTKGRWYFDEQQHHLLGLAGYIPPTPFPHFLEIRKQMTPIVEQMDKLSYPAGISTSDSHFWGFNAIALAILPRRFISEILKERMDGFKILYEMHNRGILRNHDEVVKHSIWRMKMVNFKRLHEPRFLALPESMKPLLGEKYTTFKDFWEEYDWIRLREEINTLGSTPKDATPFKVILQDPKRTECDMRIKTSPIMGLGKNFILATYVPEDEENKTIKEIFAKFRESNNGKPFLSWESH